MPKATAIVSKKSNRISLAQGNDYEVIGIDNDNYRIVDESYEPTLYPKSYFLDCEILPPEGWIYRDFGDGEYSYFPPEFARKGFLEDYYDGKSAAVKEYRAYLEKNKLLNQE